MKHNPRIAIVYDWIDKWGGVERLLLILSEEFPDAVFYTSHVDYETAPWAKKLRIIPSFMQKLPRFIQKNRVLSLPFYSFAFESFDFTDYDVVLSIGSLFSKAVITKPATKHISYILTPPRFLWGEEVSRYAKVGTGFLSRFAVRKLRIYDYIVARRPDTLVTLSYAVKDRIKKYYDRESIVVYPPFDEAYWKKIDQKAAARRTEITEKLQSKNVPDSYYLVVSRLEPYKRIDLVVSAFSQMPSVTVVIVGTGSEYKKWKNGNHPNIIFLGTVSDEILSVLYREANALIMPQVEDFGYVSLEAQYFDCPVISRRRGGALETVEDGKTGIFFDDATPTSVMETLAQFHTLAYNLRHAMQQKKRKISASFSKEQFLQHIHTLLD